MSSFMKNLLKSLISLSIVLLWGVISLALAQVISSRNSTYNNVPDYYYANYKFAEDRDAIWDWFTKANAKYSLNQEISSSEFAELSKHFDKVFPYLTKDYASVYERCSLLASSLASWGPSSSVDALLWNTCWKPLKQAINKINSSYTVKTSVISQPNNWTAPLTVTFDGRGSTDPSLETLPERNFYRYYRDEKWVDTPIWEWQVISYTFKEFGKFIVHFVVRSSNVDKWILDGEQNITINVTPKAADIVVYANTRKMSTKEPLKIWITEGERWVVFDGSLTVPRERRKILNHRWTITNTSAGFSYDSKRQEGTPGYINVPLKWNWEFKVTLTTKDNENNTVSETFYLYMSDPVTVIKQTPSNWTTSTTFNFDGSASYSITNRLNTYIWEVFDWNWDADNWNKITMVQGKKMTINENKKLKPWNYLVRLTVTDVAWNQNVETKNLEVESTTPTPQFTVTPTSKRTYPSEFTLDASNTLDVDVDNGVDSLEYKREFSTDSVEIVSTENNNEQMVVRFNEKWKHIVRLTVTDLYWKSSSVSKNIDVKSTLRPEIEIIPWPVHFWKEVDFKSSINREVWDYAWDFWDGSASINSKSATETHHIYWKRWIFSVKLTVTDMDWETNTVTEKAFIWEINQPIAAFRVADSKWFYMQTSDTCKIENGTWNYYEEEAYSVDRYAKITINPSISVNTQWTSAWLKYVFEKEAIAWADQAKISNQFTTSFSELGCHYVDLTVQDSNVWKQDKVRIRFNVKNALPKIKNITLSFPQYENNNTNAMWFSRDTNTNKSIFDCSWTSNLTIKVTAVDLSDPDGNISRLRFYYYNIDDPDRILEYKESWITEPYVYFVIPKLAWEYKFGAMVYDNDGWMIDSDDYLASNPSIYFPAACGDTDVPTVTLKVNHNNIQIWDEVIYSIVSRISADNEDFKTERTFYYDFTGDGTWDLVTKKDSATYTFTEAYEEWIVPRAAVEYRWKLWQTKWDTILVKNGIKPILLYNTYGKTAIFRDLSIWIMQQRQICFDVKECEAWNTRYRKTNIASENPSELTWGTETSITKNNSFVQKYNDYWTYKVSLYLKNKYWIEVQKQYDVKISENTSNGKIAPWINMITIPETTFNNANPEIFLSKDMKNTVVMYINNESWETCYVDTDIATDSNGDGETDNDVDVECNKLAKVKYEPDYETAVWRIYFINKGNLTFKNYYITFEWIILELDDEKREIYNDITTLFNGIEDRSVWNTDLKRVLDKLRKSLNNRSEVTSLVITIKDLISNWGIEMDQKQKDLLDSIIWRLENEDTIVSVWMNEYERNRKEILALLPPDSEWSIKSTIEMMFDDFDENVASYAPNGKAKSLESIRKTIINEGKKDKREFYEENDFIPYFCNIYDYYDISMYTDKCWSNVEPRISSNFDSGKAEPQSSSKSKFPLWLKIVLIILVWGLLTMWGIIIFFSIKAKLNSSSENEEEEW